MFGAIAPYVVAVSMMLFAAISALTLIHTVGHLDPPDTGTGPEEVRHVTDVPETVAV